MWCAQLAVSEQRDKFAKVANLWIDVQRLYLKIPKRVGKMREQRDDQALSSIMAARARGLCSECLPPVCTTEFGMW